MFKSTPVKSVLYRYAKALLGKSGFFVVCRSLRVTTVFSYTRVGARTISQRFGVGLATVAVLAVAAFAYQMISGVQPPKAYAASGDTLNFQARLETASGAIVPDGTYSIVFNIYNTSTAGSSLWNETISVTTINGYLSVTLGNTNTLTSLNWNQDMWLTMKVGADPEMSPRLKLTAVPYALQARQLQATVGSYTGTLSFSSLGANRTINLPDEAGTVCIQSSANCGFAASSGSSNYVQIQGSSPGTAQTGNFNVNGIGILGGGLTVSSGTTSITGTLNANTSGTGNTNIGTGTNSGTISVGNSTSGAITVTTGSTLAITSTNLNVTTGGRLTLAGGQSPDITTSVASGAGGALIIKPGTSSGASSNGGAVTVSGGDGSGTTSVTGGLLTLQGGSATGASGTRNGGGVSIDAGTGATANGSISIGTTNASALTIGRSGITSTVNGGLTIATGSTFTNASSTLFTAVNISNLPSGGYLPSGGAAPGNPATTVDVATTFNVNQTSTSQTLFLPSPTITTAGRVVYVNNVGTASFSMHGVTLSANAYSSFVWNGTAWVGEVAAVATSGGTVASIGTINSQTKSANGAVIASNQLIMQTADATNPGLVSTGTQTFAGDKTIQSTSTAAFVIQDAASPANLLFTADTTNDTITVGASNPIPIIANKVDYTTATSPAGIASGDFNRDGRPDIVVANNGSTSISVLLSNGAGTFGAKTDYTAGTNPSRIVVADLNGDSWPDIAVVNSGSATVGVFLNNGNGTGVFAAQVTYATGTTPVGIAAGDLNGDGRIDLVVTNSGAATVGVFQNNGQGTFATRFDLTTGTTPNGVVIADINRDGRPDIITANGGTNNISYLRNRGGISTTATQGSYTMNTTSFDAKVDYTAGTAPVNVAAGDFNNDNFVDIAATNATTNNVSVFLNTGSGGLGTATNVAVGTSPWGIASGDINGDGETDLVVTNSGGTTVSVLAGSPSGTFTSLATPTTATTPQGVVINDFNNDGKPDIALSNNGSTSLSVLLNNSQSLVVTGSSNFGSVNIADSGTLFVEGNSIFRNLTNNPNSFQIQNAAGASVINVDTSNLDVTSNLIVNGDFEGGTTGWAAKNGSTVASSTAQTYLNFSSLSAVVSTTTASSGVSYNVALASNTTYTLSFWARSTVTITDFVAGRQENGTTDTNCSINSATVSTGQWTRYFCTFTTGTTSGTTNIYIQKTAAVATSPPTFYVDAVQLQMGSRVTPFNATGALQVGGVINSQLTIQPKIDSVNAFGVMNASGSRHAIIVDTVNNRLGVNTQNGPGYGLEVNGNGYVNQGLYVASFLNPFGTTSNILQVQNGSRSVALGVDTTTTSGNTNNLISNGDFEAGQGVASWTNKNGASCTAVTTQVWQGVQSQQCVSNTTANAGTSFSYTMTANTTYTLSFYARTAAGTSYTDIDFGRQDVTGTDITCSTGNTVTSTWRRYSCTFTTGATITSSNIFIQRSSVANETFFIDGVQLQTGSVSTGFNTTAGVFMGAAINGPTLFQNRSDSTNNIQIQNSYGVGLLNVDTLTVNNLISNGGLESGATTGWAIKNSATAVAAVTSGTTAPFEGLYSLQVQATATANSGAALTYAFSPNTTYTLSFYAKIASGAQNTDFVFGRQDNGSDITCATGQTISQTWQRFSCTFTTGATISSSNIFFQKSGGTGYNFYIDNIVLQPGQYSVPGTLQIFAPITSAMTFQNSSNTTNAFQIQNAAGTSNLFVADTTNTRIGIAKANPAYTLDVGGSIGASGLITGTLGVTISGAAASINDNSNFNTTINTGTSTGLVTIGNSGTAANSVTLAAGSTGGINLNSALVATNQATISLLNSTATTVNAFGAATNINMGASGGSATFGNTGAFTLQGVSNQNFTVRSQGTGALTLQSGSGTVGFNNNNLNVGTGTIAARAANFTGYNTTGTSNLYNNQYTKLGTCTITAQYQDCNSVADIVNIGDGSTSNWRARVNFRVKQQAAMASAPYINLEVFDVKSLVASDFVAVTTQNDATATVVELYGKIRSTYQEWRITPSVNSGSNASGVVWLSLQTFSASLPAGTQTNAVYSDSFLNTLNVTSSNTSGATLTVANSSYTTNNSRLTDITFTNANTSASSITVSGLSVTPTGTTNANSNANTLNSILLPNVTTISNNTFNGLYVGTGYNSILNYNGTSIINGTGVLQSAGLSGTYSNSLTLSNTGNTYSGTSMTLGGAGALTLGTNGPSGNTGSVTFRGGSVATNYIQLKGQDSPTGTLVLSLPNIAVNDTLCAQTLNNCGGGLTGSGTANYVTRFTGTTTLSTGQLYDTGTAVSVGGTSPGTGGLFNVGTTNQFQVSSAGNVTAGTISSGTINGQTISSTANFTGTVTIQGAAALELGQASTNTGAITFRGSGNGNYVQLRGPNSPTAGNFVLSIPAITGNANICTDNSICTGYASSSSLSGYVQLQGSTPGTQQTGNLNINGVGIFGGGLTVSSGTTAASGTINLNSTGTSVTTNINTTASANTLNIGSANTTFQLQSNALNVSTLGALTGVTGITTSGGYTQSGLNTNTFTGATTVQNSLTVNPASNSTATLDVKYAGGTESILSVDTSNDKIYVMSKSSGSLYGNITTQDTNANAANSQGLLISTGNALGTASDSGVAGIWTGDSSYGKSGFAVLTSGQGYTGSGGIVIASGQANNGTAGDIVVDVGTSTSGSGTIRIGNSDSTTATVGNALNVALGNDTSGSKILTYGSITANGSATGSSATTSGTGTNTTTLTFTGTTGFANGDVIFIDNTGQDYYTRITAGGNAASVTVSPAITFENTRTVTKYNVQSIGANSSNNSYSTLNDRFFQGYFLGGVVVGTASTTLSDGLLQSTGALNLTGAAASTWSIGSNALTVTSSNFNVSNAGVLTLAGGQTRDITANANLTVQPAGVSDDNNPGYDLNLKGGNNSLSGGGGSVIIQAANGAIWGNGGNVQITAGNGFDFGGDVTITAGSGGSASGTIKLQSPTTLSAGNSFTMSSGLGTYSQTYTGTATAKTVTLANTSGTQTNGMLIDRNGAGGTTTNLLQLQNTLGTATNALTITGTFTNLINSTNFKVSNAGVLTLAGGQSADITTPAATTSTALILKPGTSSGASSNGARTTISGGDGSGTTLVTGGSLTLQGGAATGASGTRIGGDVLINAGSGATLNGKIILGSSNTTNVFAGSLTYGTNGTAGTSTTISQTTNTITGSGTTFTSNMTGGTIYYSDGTTATVTFVSATSLTSSVSKTVTAGSTYTIVYGGLNITSTGTATLQPTTDSTTAFRVQNAAGTSILTVDSTNQRVAVGSAAPANGVLTVGTNTTAASGGIYFGTDASANLYRNNTNSLRTDGALTVGNGLTVVAGVLTLAGGQSADITTPAATTATAITVKPGTSSGASSNGGAVTISAGDTSGTTGTITGGLLTLQGGAANGASGTRNGGSVQIDAGTGTTANGSISIGTLTSGVTVNVANAINTVANTVNIANGASAANSTVNILSGVGTAGVGTLLMGNNTRVTSIDIGNVAAAAARTINLGTGANTVGIDTINIGTGATTVAGGKTIKIGSDAPGVGGTNLITIGTTTNASTTTIQGGTGASAVSIQSGASGTISIGTTVQTSTLSLGNTSASSTTTIRGGTGASAVSIQSGAGGGISIAAGNATAANGSGGNIVIQNSALTSGGSGINGAFQVINPNGAVALSVDSSMPGTGTGSLLSSLSGADFENGTTNSWSAKNSATLSVLSTTSWQGRYSLQVAATSTANSGIALTTGGLLASGNYTITFFAKVASGSITDLVAGYTLNGGADQSCTLNSNTVTTSWQRFTCSFQAPASPAITSSTIFIGKSGAVAETILVDGISWNFSGIAPPFNAGSSISFGGSINSPVAFMNREDSNYAFQIQNAGGNTNLFVADTTNTRIGIAKVPTTYTLDVGGSIGASGLITGTLGVTISGAVASINVNSNFNTNINTGTSTGLVTIGNSGTAANSVTLAAGSTGGINLNSALIATNQSNITLLNTTATTVSAFGAATSLSMGASSGTTTINSNTVRLGTGTTTIQGGTGNLTISPTDNTSGGSSGSAPDMTVRAGSISNGANINGGTWTGGNLYLYSGSSSSGFFGTTNPGNVVMDTGTGGNAAIQIGTSNATTVQIGRSSSALSVSSSTIAISSASNTIQGVDLGGTNTGTALTVRAGKGGSTGGTGGLLSLLGGDTGQTSTAANGGAVLVKGGATFYGTGGGVTLSGGDATVNTLPGNGGSVSITGGAGGYGGVFATSPSGGNVSITGGTSVGASGAATVTGGSVTIQGGSPSGTATTLNGGSVTIDGGTGTSANGNVNIGTVTGTKTVNISNIAPATGATNTIQVGATASATTGTTSITIGGTSTGTNGATTVTILAGNQSGSTTAGNSKGINVSLGNTASTVAVCSSLASATNPTSGTAYELRDCSATPAADYAEMYPVVQGINYGDIVVTGTRLVNTYDESNGGVDWDTVKGQVTELVKSSTNYQSNTVGIVSNNYGDFTSAGHNIKPEDNPMPVALNGRVPVNMAPDSPAIEPGDFITTSGTYAGKGTKATGAGYVVGKALEAWDPASGDTQVMVFVENGFYPGPSMSTYIQNGGNASLANLQVDGTASFNDINMSGTANFNELKVVTATVSGNLEVKGLLKVADIEVNGHIITKGDTPTIAAETNAGTDAVCTVTGNDTSGKITINTGTANWASGAQCTITFSKPYGANPNPVITPTAVLGATTDTSSVKPYVDATTNTMSISFTAADNAPRMYVFNYFNVQ